MNVRKDICYFCLLLSLSAPVITFAANYEITPQELITLAEAQTQLATLKEQLEASQATLTLQRTQLETANQSLTALSNEMRRERQRLERQRNIAYIIAAGMMYAAISK